MTLIEDSQEGQLDCAHLLYKGQQLEREYLPMSIQAKYNVNTSANSCVDRLNTESSRNSASRLMHGDPHLPASL